MMRDALITIAAILFVFVGGFFVGHATRPEQPAPVIKRDTLVVRDTLIKTQPVAVTRYVRDTMKVSVCDTLREHDTLYVQLPREVVEYKDSNFYAAVSGFRPSLDSLQIYRATEYITATEYIKEPRKRWGFGIQAGGGVIAANGKISVSPYIGVGVSYNIFTW